MHHYKQLLLLLALCACLLAGDSSAFSALGRTAAELQQWPTAAAAYGRSAELHAAVGEVEEQATELVLSGKHWLNAVAEVRQQQKAAAAAAKDKHGRSSTSSSASSSKGSSSQGSGSSSAEGSSDGTDEPISWGVNVDKEQVRPFVRFLKMCVPAWFEDWCNAHLLCVLACCDPRVPRQRQHSAVRIPWVTAG